MSEGPTTHLPLSAIADLVAQYHHRLLSLEADLKDRARAGGLDPALFAKRVKTLKEVHRELNALQRLCIAETPGRLTNTDIGLPVLDDCTPEELRVVELFLEERELDVLELEQEASKVYTWLQDAISGKVGALRLTLRLSKLRALIAGHEKRAATQAEEARALNLSTEKLISQTSGGKSREAGRSTLDALMELFASLEATISRVAKLKAASRREEAKVEAMRSWLREHEGKLQHLRSASPPPTPLATAQAARDLPQKMAKEIHRSKRRRDLIERFWQEVVSQPSASTESTTITPTEE